MFPHKVATTALTLLALGLLRAGAYTDPAKDDPTKKPPAPVAEKFHTIILEGSGNVIIRQTGKETVTSDPDPTQAQTRIEKGVLHLTGVTNYVIEVKELRSIHSRASGNLEVKDLKGKKLDVEVSGSGNVAVVGLV